MSEQPSIPGRARTIFRLLSVLTLIEAVLGLLLTAFEISMGSYHNRALETLLGRAYSDSWLVYLIELIALAFNVLLLAAGALLWKQQRRGLRLLICILIAEFIFVLGLGGAFASGGLSKVQDYLVGMGVMPFSPQIVTAFPIVSGILIFFAYRYLGIPAKPTE